MSSLEPSHFLPIHSKWMLHESREATSAFFPTKFCYHTCEQVSESTYLSFMIGSKGQKKKRCKESKILQLENPLISSKVPSAMAKVECRPRERVCKALLALHICPCVSGSFYYQSGSTNWVSGESPLQGTREEGLSGGANA